MISKQSLITNIKRYYLGGLIEKTRWDIDSNSNININFLFPGHDAIGNLRFNLDLPECSIAIGDTSRLIKMLSILDDDIEIYHDTSNFKLSLKDKKYSISFSLVDPNIIKIPPSLNETNFKIKFSITEDLYKMFDKAKSALGSNIKKIFTVLPFHNESSTSIKIILGESNIYSNQIDFNLDASFEGFPPEPMIFNSDYFNEILSANSDCIGECYLDPEGLMKISFNNNNNNISSEYFLTKMENV